MEEIKSIIMQNLKQRGDLSQLQAAVRKCVLASIEGLKASPAPKPDGDTYILLEIINEFLRYMGLESTAGTLEIEAQLPPVPISRQYVGRSIGLGEECLQNELPLLCNMLALCKQLRGCEAVVVDDTEGEEPRA